MDRKKMMFCPDMGELTKKAIAKELAEKVFGDEHFSTLLEARYSQMQTLFRDVKYDDSRWNLNGCSNKADPEKRDARLIVPRDQVHSNNPKVMDLFDCDNFGHDMPVWLSYNDDKNAKRVMIISQDPLRGDDEKGNLYLSTPFGVHSKDFENSGRAHMDARIRDIINILLEKGACIYLTDNLKLYATHNNRKIVQEDVCHGRNGYKEKFSGVIDEEIRRFNPRLILTLGVMSCGKSWTDSVLKTIQHPRFGGGVQELDGVQKLGLKEGGKVMALVHPGKADIWVKRWELAKSADTYFGEIMLKACKCLEDCI